MCVVDTYDASESGCKRTVFVVRVRKTPTCYVDVMYIHNSGLCYVMQTEDGGLVYTDSDASVACSVDMKKVEEYVRTKVQKRVLRGVKSVNRR